MYFYWSWTIFGNSQYFCVDVEIVVELGSVKCFEIMNANDMCKTLTP